MHKHSDATHENFMVALGVHAQVLLFFCAGFRDPNIHAVEPQPPVKSATSLLFCM